MLTVCFLTAVPALRCPLRAFGEPSWTCSSTHPRITAVPALRCPPWAFGEPSRTCFTNNFTSHSSPGVTVSFSGIRRAKLDVLHATGHQSQQSRRYGVLLGIRRAKQDVLHATGHQSQQSRRYGVLLGHSASQAGHAPLHEPHVTAVPVVNWQGQDKMSSQLFHCVALCVDLWSQAVVWGRAGPSGAQTLALSCFTMINFASRNRRAPCCLPTYSPSLDSGHCRRQGRRCSPRSWWQPRRRSTGYRRRPRW